MPVVPLFSKTPLESTNSGSTQLVNISWEVVYELNKLFNLLIDQESPNKLLKEIIINYAKGGKRYKQYFWISFFSNISEKLDSVSEIRDDGVVILKSITPDNKIIEELFYPREYFFRVKKNIYDKIKQFISENIDKNIRIKNKDEEFYKLFPQQAGSREAKRRTIKHRKNNKKTSGSRKRLR